MQFGIIRVCADERAISRLRLVVLASRTVKIGKIPLQGRSWGVRFSASCNSAIASSFFSCAARTRPELNVGSCLIWVCRHDLTQLRFGIGKAPTAHIDVRQSNHRLRRRRIDS